SQTGVTQNEDTTKKLNNATITTKRGIFYDTVTTVRSFDGKTVAFVHIGSPQNAIDNKVNAIIVRSIVVFFAFFLISFALVVYFVKSSIITPISTLLESVTRISQG